MGLIRIVKNVLRRNLINGSWRIRVGRENSKRQRESGKYKDWQRNNKDKIRQYNKNREKNKMHEISDSEWLSCKAYFNNSCAYCGLHEDEHYRKHYGKMKRFDLHKDHVDHEGANDLSNCVPACQSCNSSKHNKELEEWYRPNNELWCEVYSHERLSKINKWLNDNYKLYINKN